MSERPEAGLSTREGSIRQAAAVRQPPQALDAEAAVLGAILLDPEAMARVMEVLGANSEHFYLQIHRKVYEAMVHLNDQTRPTDPTSVATELKRMKQLDAVGGMPFVSGLMDSVLTTAHCAEHARLVLEKSVQRRLIQTATEIVQAGYDDTRPADQLLDVAEQKIFEIRQSGTRKGFEELKGLLFTEVERIEKAQEMKRLITGIETGFHDLDEKTSGLQPGTFVIVAGRPSMGKTALALNIAVSASLRAKVPVAVFSLEMSTELLVQRLICSSADISMNNLRRGMLSGKERARLAAACGPLSECQIFIDDTPGLNALEIRARARRLKSEKDLGLVVVDYLQLMEASGDMRRERNRQQEITEISRSLKAMAKELNTPVVALSQLSRLPERREDKRPQLADLRESGAIEQDADLVLLLYRPKFYHPEDETLEDSADLIIAKQRNGPLGVIKLTFLARCMRFESQFRPGIPEPAAPPDQEDYLPR